MMKIHRTKGHDTLYKSIVDIEVSHWVVRGTLHEQSLVLLILFLEEIHAGSLLIETKETQISF